MPSGKAFWINNFFGILLAIGMTSFFLSCSEDRESRLSKLKENLSLLNDLRFKIESRYAVRLSDTTSERHYLIFRDCGRDWKISEDYVCDDAEVMRQMNLMGIKEIEFRRTNRSCSEQSIFNEVYFLIDHSDRFSTVSYLYEYCGTGSKYESDNIYYEPVDNNWSLYIDSSFP